jgi:hypothetical protein
MQKEKPTQKKRKNKVVNKLSTKKKIRDPRATIFTGSDGKKYKVTPKERAFCEELIANGGNGLQAALLPYDIPNAELVNMPVSYLKGIEQKRLRKVAMITAGHIASQNCQKVHIKRYIAFILDKNGFTDDDIKFEHYKAIKQDDSWTDKLRGIDMFHKLKNDYPPEKVDVTGKITSVEVVQYGKPKD